MGAWSTQIFKNDDALDWLNELEDRGCAAIEDAFRATKGKYIELPEASAALAAAETVAALAGHPAGQLPRAVRSCVEAQGTPKGIKSLQKSAATAVRRVRTKSELQELWEESPKHRQWADALRDLELRLALEPTIGSGQKASQQKPPGKTSTRPAKSGKQRSKRAGSARRGEPQLGDIVAVPLANGRFAYGRVHKHQIAIYNKQSAKLQTLDAVLGAAVAYHLKYYIHRKTGCDWIVLGNEPFASEKEAYGPPGFSRDILDIRKVRIVDERGYPRPAKLSEIADLEPASMNPSSVIPQIIADRDRIARKFKQLGLPSLSIYQLVNPVLAGRRSRDPSLVPRLLRLTGTLKTHELQETTLEAAIVNESDERLASTLQQIAKRWPRHFIEVKDFVALRPNAKPR